MKVYFKEYSLIFLLFFTSIIYYFIGYWIDRTNFWPLIMLVGLQFLMYFYALKFLPFNWLLAILPRFILCFSVPALSDDYFRFVWDGNLMANGINPFQYLPSALPPNEIYEGMNSKNYFSVYPPILQIIFGICSYLSDGNLFFNLVLLKLFILGAEMGSIYLIIKLLKHLNKPKNLALIYALNPLVIIELTGNIHFEAISIFFLLLCFYGLFVQKNIYQAAIGMACAALIKMLPFIFIPLIIKYLGAKKGIIFSLISILLFGLSFLPFLNFEVIQNISKSLNLYFQKFEFNASIYYVVRWLGLFLNDNNPIQIAGPLLSIIGLGVILRLIYQKDSKFTPDNSPVQNKFELIKIALIILTIYFFMATTVHPWYLTTLVALASLGQFKYPLVWSAMAFLSYSAYKAEGFNENLGLVFIEYLVVTICIFIELFPHKVKRS